MDKPTHITFFIPMLPISVNAAYTINRSTLVLTRKAWEKKGYMSMFVKKITLEPNQIYKLKYEYHGDWFYKNGNVKKVDGPNMDKMLIDVISEKLQHDDCFLWDWHGKKVQNIEKEGVLCELTLIQGITNGRDAEKSSEGNTDGSEKNYGASWS